MAKFPDLSSAEGLKALDEFLLTRSYIDGFQASRDDLVVYSAISSEPDSKSYPHAARWYKHVQALLGASFPGQGKGVNVAGAAALASAAADAAPDVAAATKGEEEPMEYSDEEDSDEDLDLFGDMTPEEQAAAEEKKKIIETAKARAAAKAKLTKSMIVMDVKPWDDETDLKDMEAEVRACKHDGLLWGASKLVPIGFGIKKMQITAVIEDAKVESMDAIIEEELVKDGESQTIQSIDVVSFNKL